MFEPMKVGQVWATLPTAMTALPHSHAHEWAAPPPQASQLLCLMLMLMLMLRGGLNTSHSSGPCSAGP